MKCLVTKGDITKIKADAIVNAANNSLLGGGGVDGAIHRAAGRGLYEECKNLGGCKTGEAKITKGCNLPSKYVIHTVGPIWHDHSRDKNIELLRMCYINCMNVARDNHIKTIAFPSISTGVYAFPKELAAETALQALSDWFNANINDEMSNIEITFVCFDDTSFNIYNGLINKYFSI